MSIMSRSGGSGWNGCPEELIRRATTADLPGIVEIHERAFGAFFLTRLGADFLRSYYGLVLEYRSGIMLVAQRGGAVQGFACGFLEPSEFYRLMWRKKSAFALPVLAAVARRPYLISKVLHAVQRIHAPLSEWPANSCELSSIAVTPERAGNGFGKTLIAAFVAHARAMCARCVYLTTDAEGNDAANFFYCEAGFRRTKRFRQQGGRWMNEYVIDGARASGQPKTIPWIYTPPAS